MTHINSHVSPGILSYATLFFFFVQQIYYLWSVFMSISTTKTEYKDFFSIIILVRGKHMGFLILKIYSTPFVIKPPLPKTEATSI